MLVHFIMQINLMLWLATASYWSPIKCAPVHTSHILIHDYNQQSLFSGLEDAPEYGFMSDQPQITSQAPLPPSALLASLASRASIVPAANSGSVSSTSGLANGCPEGPFPHRELDVASKAFLAPIVFTGQLVSLSEDYTGRIAATFRVIRELKNQAQASSLPTEKHTQITAAYSAFPASSGHVILYFVRKPGAWFQPPHCAVYLNNTALGHLRLQSKYVLFAAAPLPDLLRLHQLPTLANDTMSAIASLHYLSAFAPPEPLTKKNQKSVYKVTCKKCRKYFLHSFLCMLSN